jgi:hypothetical protein
MLTEKARKVMKKVSQFLLPTLKQQQQGALQVNIQKSFSGNKESRIVTVPPMESSHDLLVRAGFLRQSNSGLFTILPYGLLVLQKIEKLIDEEMGKIGGQKVSE